jgi:ATP-dependent DNA helicase RecQ
VPSRRNQSVSLLCNELAEKLNFSSASCIKKIRNNDQQKYMENSSYQKMNLDGVFSVTDSHKLKNKNIILIDDVVNSKWTLTVCAALLKEAGAKKVYPLALAARNGDNIVEHFF